MRTRMMNVGNRKSILPLKTSRRTTRTISRAGEHQGGELTVSWSRDQIVIKLKFSSSRGTAKLLIELLTNFHLATHKLIGASNSTAIEFWCEQTPRTCSCVLEAWVVHRLFYACLFWWNRAVYWDQLCVVSDWILISHWTSHAHVALRSNLWTQTLWFPSQTPNLDIWSHCSSSKLNT